MNPMQRSVKDCPTSMPSKIEAQPLMACPESFSHKAHIPINTLKHNPAKPRWIDTRKGAELKLKMALLANLIILLSGYLVSPSRLAPPLRALAIHHIPAALNEECHLRDELRRVLQVSINDRNNVALALLQS